nr:hypothetical protein [Acidimicrobiia bacterium]
MPLPMRRRTPVVEPGGAAPALGLGRAFALLVLGAIALVLGASKADA